MNYIPFRSTVTLASICGGTVWEAKEERRDSGGGIHLEETERGGWRRDRESVRRGKERGGGNTENEGG